MRLPYLPLRTFKDFALGLQAVDKFLSVFIEPLRKKDVILSIAKGIEEEMKNVLVGRKSTLKKSHTFIQDFPDGKEKGEFLGVHFEHGLINIAGIKVDGSRTLASVYETVVVPEEERLLRGTERVFFVAQSLKNFSRRLRIVELPDIGPTWNIGVNHGYLEVDGRFGLTSLHTLSWPDEYNFTGKPVRMLNLGKQIVEAADLIGLNVEIKGFLHTPEAVFLDGCWKYPNVVGSLSLDDRCVMCVKARTSDVGKLSYKNEEKPFILLKIFLNSFGDSGELDQILNLFDDLVDKTSHTVNQQTFEQLVSEEYIIKLVRIVVLAMVEEGHLFSSDEGNRTRLKDYMQEITHRVSSMSRSYSRGMWDHLIRTFRFESLSVNESAIIGRVVEVVSWRASLLLGIVLAVWLRHSAPLLTKSPIFLINGTYSKNEINYITEAVRYVLSLYGESEQSTNEVLFTTQSHVFGAAVLAAIYTKNPFDYDEDFFDKSERL